MRFTMRENKDQKKLQIFHTVRLIECSIEECSISPSELYTHA